MCGDCDISSLALSLLSNTRVPQWHFHQPRTEERGRSAPHRRGKKLLFCFYVFFKMLHLHLLSHRSHVYTLVAGRFRSFFTKHPDPEDLFNAQVITFNSDILLYRWMHVISSVFQEWIIYVNITGHQMFSQHNNIILNQTLLMSLSQEKHDRSIYHQRMKEWTVTHALFCAAGFWVFQIKPHKRFLTFFQSSIMDTAWSDVSNLN